jgi:hypothetical protein
MNSRSRFCAAKPPKANAVRVSGMAEIVESRRQIQIANESTGSRPYEIRHSDSVVPGIRFVDAAHKQESPPTRAERAKRWASEATLP